MSPRRPVPEAIDLLADLFEYGHLQVSTDPAAFLDRVRDEIIRLRAEVERLRAMLGFVRQRLPALEFEAAEARPLPEGRAAGEDEEHLCQDCGASVNPGVSYCGDCRKAGIAEGRAAGGDKL